jgi:pyruvate dehydrogenase E2 component (dihydrolipoyllysine-residue acetyltransferase)
MTNPDIHPVTMPKWGLSMTQGKIIEWLVAEGDEITPGMEIVEIDTDKIVGTLEATDGGVLRRIVAPTGTDAPVGGTIALIAPAEVADAAIDEMAGQAREQLASGEVAAEAGPVIGAVDVGGRSIAYATLGTDSGTDPIVLVHGYGGDKNSWLFVQEPLAAHTVVHAIDLPGHGSSGKDVGDGTLSTLAGTVLGVLDGLGVRRAHLVGHSLGGAVVAAVAAAVAATEPDRVRSLTLVAPAGFGADADAGYLRGFADATSRRELKPQLGKLFADESQVTRQLVDDLLRYKRLDGVDQALKTLVGTLLDGDRQAIDTPSLLAQSTVPTVIVWGRADRVLPAAGAALAGDRAEVRYVDNAGHMVHMEAPGEVVAAVRTGIQTGG